MQIFCEKNNYSLRNIFNCEPMAWDWKTFLSSFVWVQRLVNFFVDKVFQIFQGSLGFFFDGILVTGDTVYRTDHELIDWYPGSSSIDMASSVTKILNMSHEVNLALPGSVGSSLSSVTFVFGRSHTFQVDSQIWPPLAANFLGLQHWQELELADVKKLNNSDSDLEWHVSTK